MTRITDSNEIILDSRIERNFLYSCQIKWKSPASWAPEVLVWICGLGLQRRQYSGWRSCPI